MCSIRTHIAVLNFIYLCIDILYFKDLQSGADDKLMERDRVKRRQLSGKRHLSCDCCSRFPLYYMFCTFDYRETISGLGNVFILPSKGCSPVIFDWEKVNQPEFCAF